MTTYVRNTSVPELGMAAIPDELKINVIMDGLVIQVGEYQVVFDYESACRLHARLGQMIERNTLGQ